MLGAIKRGKRGPSTGVKEIYLGAIKGVKEAKVQG
jgi:hypothetical protein